MTEGKGKKATCYCKSRMIFNEWRENKPSKGEKIKEKSSAWADVYRELKLGYTAVPWRAIVST